MVNSIRFGIPDKTPFGYNRVLKPSVRKASSSPMPSTSTTCLFDKASLISIFPFTLILAGLVYSSITSIGENTVLYNMVALDFDTYVLAYTDNGNDGTIKTFDFATTAATINPRISAVSIAADNSTIAVTFNEPVFNATGGSGSLQANDFALSLSGGSASLGSATPTSISASSNTYTLGMNISGTANGFEQITVTPVDNGIYDATNNEASTSQLMNSAYLHDKLGAVITGTSRATDNSTVSVTFNETVFKANNATGDLEVADFALSISGGTASLASATPTSISIVNQTYTLGVSYSGTPNGSETLTVTPVSNSIYDFNGNASSNHWKSIGNSSIPSPRLPAGSKGWEIELSHSKTQKN